MQKPYPLGLDPEDLPSYLAHPWKGYWEEEHPRVRLAWMVDTAELCVRWAVALALAEVRHSDPVGLSADVASRIRKDVEHPTLGQWLAVLRALHDAMPKAPLLVPGVFRLALDICDRQFAAKGTAETSLLVLRNDVAHGGGLSSSRARELLQSHGERFEGLVRALSEVTHDVDLVAVSDRGAVRLRGTTPKQLDREGLPADVRGSCLVGQKLTGEKVILSLWPFAAFGRVRLLDGNGALVEQTGDEAPLIYSRSDRESLDYTPLGRDELHSADLDVTAFRNLFRLDEARTKRKDDLIDGFLPGDFLLEAMVEEMVGRRQELQTAKDWLQRRDGRLEGVARVGWISAGPGMGKSMLVAKVASDLSHAPTDRQGLFFHRFRAGDGRNSRSSFLRLLQTALWQWEPLRVVTEAPSAEADGRTLEEDVKARIAKVADLPPPRSRAPRPRFLVFADGLDELAPLDPGFPDLVKDLALPGTVWVLAGRPELNLTIAFDAPGCEALFGQGGLPLMSSQDVREMLETGLGLGRYALLKRDDELNDTIVNPFVDSVVERAQGLPIYVRLLLEDLRRGYYTVADENKLPEGLSAYYDQILNRIGLSTVRHDLSALVCYLAIAAEPLDTDALAILVAGGPKTAADLAYRRRIDDALRAGRSLLRLAPTNDGSGGWALYHQSFREYVAGRPAEVDTPALPSAPALADLVREAEYRLVLAAEWWQELPVGNLRNHLFRRGTHYALVWQGEAGAAAAAARFMDFGYLMTRIDALGGEGVFELSQELALLHDQAGWEALEPWVRFAREKTHVLALLDAAGLLQEAVAVADDSPVTRSAERWIERVGGWKEPWLRRRGRPGTELRSACLQTLAGHTHGVMSVAISSDGKTAVSAGGSGLVWDLATGRCLRTLKVVPAEVVLAVAITPDGQTAISAPWIFGKTLRVWDLGTGQSVRALEGHTEGVTAVAIAHDGKTAISASRDHTLRVWDLATGLSLRTLEDHTEAVNAVALSPDGRTAVSASNDATLKVWDFATGRCLRTLVGHTRGVADVAIAPDGKTTVSGSADGTLRVWDLATGLSLRTLEASMRSGYRAPPYFVNAVAITPDGKIAVSASDDRTLKLWDLATGRCLRILEGHTDSVTAVAIAPDGRTAVSGGAGADKTIRIWDLAPVISNRHIEGHTSSVAAVAIASDGKTAISGSEDETLKVWDLATGRCLRTLEGHTDRGFLDRFTGNHPGSVNAVALSPDGRTAVSASNDTTLKVWDLGTGRCLRTLEGHTLAVRDVAIAPDGKTVVSGSRDQTLKVWDLATVMATRQSARRTFLRVWWDLVTGRARSALAEETKAVLLRTLKGHGSQVNAVAISPDSTAAISGSDDHTLRLWDLETGDCVGTLEGHDDRVNSVAIAPDSTAAISGSDDHSLKVWDLATGDCLTLKEHTDGVSAVAIAPDGKTLVSASDKTITVMVLRNGEGEARWVNEAQVSACAIGPGNVIAIGDAVGRVLFLDLI